MKKNLLLFALFLLLNACSIRITEKTIFSNSAYKTEEYTVFLKKNEDLSESEKADMQTVLKNLPSKEKTHLLEKEDITVKRLFFKANDSLNLEYWVFEPAKYERQILFFSGNSMILGYILPQLQKLAIQTRSMLYCLNYRGYGYSEGVASFETQFVDNQLFYENICAKRIQPVSVIGYSLGSIFASKLASENELKNLILLAPFSETAAMIKHLKRRNTKGLKMIFRSFVKVAAAEELLKLKTTDFIKKYPFSLTIAHSEDDDSLPFSMGKCLFEISPSKNKVFIELAKGSKHTSVFRKENWEKIGEQINSRQN